MTDFPVTRWWWLRHAPVVDAHLHLLNGQADTAADVSDSAAFAALAPQLPSDAVWITTPLQRTAQTAEALWRAGAPSAAPLIEPAFVEQAFGDWTGCTWKALGERSDAQAFWEAPATQRPPGAPSESFADVCARVAPAIERCNRQYAGRDIVCVAHAGSIRAAVALALGLSPAQALAVDVQNLGLSRLDFVAPDNWRVVALNQIC